MAGLVSSLTENLYGILMEDADGRRLRLESFQDLNQARERLPILATQYPGTRLILWDYRTHDILAQTEGY